MASQGFEQFMAQVQQLSTLVDTKQKELDELRKKNAEEREERRKQYAEDRRAGKQGRAWQVLQQRIDMGQTCERDIIMGLDTSAEAREVRAQAAKALDAMRTAVSELPEDDPAAQQLRQLRERQQSR